MTIGDLETRTGIPRATIRYYEQEGFFAPRRMENGYRDYSPEDQETLLRIKLLRQLNFSLEEIRQLQQREVDFSEAMNRRGRQLALDRDQLDTAQQVCLDMGREVRAFQDLRAEEYLSRLSGVQPLSPAPQQDRQEPHPWRRYFARAMDVSLATLVILLIQSLVLHSPLQGGNVANIGRTLLAWGIVLLVEPLFLHFLGTTPGKWVWGIRVEGRDGGRLPLGESYRRTFLVFVAGEGMTIPVVDLICHFRSYRKYTQGEDLLWEEDSVLRFRERGWVSPAIYGASIAARLGVAVCAVLLSLLPPCRGELSVAAFAENFNFYCALAGEDRDGFYLDDTGAWERTYVNNILVLEEPSHPAFSIETENGVVRSVSYALELPRQAETVTLTNIPAQMAYLALAAAQPETDLWNVQKFFRTMRGWNAARSFSCQWGDIAMDYIVDLNGFGVMTGSGTDDNALLFPYDDEPNYLTVTFRVEAGG